MSETMATHEMTDRLRQLLQEVVDEKLSIGTDDNLFKLGILDSVLLIQLVTRLESQFGISVADREMVPDNFLSLDRIRLYLAQKMGGTNGASPLAAGRA